MGGDIHYAYNRHGTLAFLIETGDAFQPDGDDVKAELKRVFPGILEMLKIPIALHGSVTDKKTKQPLVAKLSVPSLAMKLDEVSPTSKTGQYHLWLPEGKWSLKIDVHGRPSVNKEVNIQAGANELHLEV